MLGIIGKLRKKEDVNQINNELNDLEAITDLSIDDILIMEPRTMVTKLEELAHFNLRNIELFAEALYEMHGFLDSMKGNLLLQRALFLLEYVETKEQTFSISRNQLMESIKNAHK